MIVPLFCHATVNNELKSICPSRPVVGLSSFTFLLLGTFYKQIRIYSNFPPSCTNLYSTLDSMISHWSTAFRPLLLLGLAIFLCCLEDTKDFILSVWLYDVLTQTKKNSTIRITIMFCFDLEFIIFTRGSSIGSWEIYQQSSGVFVFHEIHLKRYMLGIG